MNHRSAACNRFHQAFLLGAAVLVFLAQEGRAADPGASSSASAPRVIEVRIAARRAVDTPDPIVLREGEKVVLRWTTDEPALIHLHGYDIEARLVPGKPTTMAIDARIVGRFAIGAHAFGSQPSAHGARSHREAPLLYLEVHPK